MTDPVIGPARFAPPARPGRDADPLRRVAHEFEGVFVAQLFREMRATVPSDDEAPGQDMYLGLMDDALAGQAAERSTRGLGEALYRQLAARFNGADHDIPSR